MKVVVMRLSCWFYIVCALLLVGCSDELSMPSDSSCPLAVFVNNAPVRKSQVEGVYMPDRAEIGLFLRAEEGSFYDGQDHDNVKYTASGIEETQTWEMDPAHPVGLSRTKGVCYAYYPWHLSGVSLNAIPITNDGTDWMYAEAPVTNLSNQNPVARFRMLHAMTIIRCHIQKGNYVGAGVVHGMSVRGDALASGATLDLTVPEVSMFVGTGEPVLKEEVGSIAEQSLTVDLWAVPTGTASALNFSLKVDERSYQVSAESFEALAGSVYNFTFTIDGETLVLADITNSDWIESEDHEYGPELDTSDYAVDWEVAKETDGVYAITSEGKALAYEYATASDYAGVAVVVLGKAYQVAKSLAPANDGTYKIYFDKTVFEEIPGLQTYILVSDWIMAGFLPKADGSYQADDIERYIEGDYRKWAVYDTKNAALSDFNGRANTELIIAAQTVDGVVRGDTCGEVVLKFRANEELNEGFDDWFIPGLGQLGYIWLKKKELDDLILRLGGRTLSANHMSSSVPTSKGVYRIDLSGSGFVCANNRDVQQYALRLIREL